MYKYTRKDIDNFLNTSITALKKYDFLSDYKGYLLEYQREVILKYISNFNNDNISKLAA